MEVVQVGAIVIALAISLVGVGFFARAVHMIIRVVKLGRPTPDVAIGRAALETPAGRDARAHPDAAVEHHRHRSLVRLRCFRCALLYLVTAYGQLFDPRFALPVIGHWVPYEAASELIAWAGLGSILYLITVRVLSPNRKRASRFFGSWLAGLLRRVHDLGHRSLRSGVAGAGISAARPRPPGCTSRRRGSCCPSSSQCPFSKPRSW